MINQKKVQKRTRSANNQNHYFYYTALFSVDQLSSMTTVLGLSTLHQA